MNANEKIVPDRWYHLFPKTDNNNIACDSGLTTIYLNRGINGTYTFGAMFVLFWCDFGAVFVLFSCDFFCDVCAILVGLWCGVFHIHRTYTAQIPEKGKRRWSGHSKMYENAVF